MNENEPPSIHFGAFKMSLAGPWWAQLIEGLVVLGLVVWSIIWIVSDASRRGKNGFLAFIFLFMASWPISLLFWLWLRPPLLKPELPPLTPLTPPSPPPPPVPPIPATDS